VVNLGIKPTKMELEKKARLEKIRSLKEEFGLDQKRIADNCEPPRDRVTVAKLLSGTDERYLTETNIAAVEKGIEKLLDEYRKKLCR
jgi:hypothetical protein